MIRRFNKLFDILKDEFWPALKQGLWVAGLTALFVLGVPGARPDPTDNAFTALGVARDHLFDFSQWEVQTLLDKGSTAALGTARYMRPEARTQFVRDYLQLVGEIGRLESEVRAVYVDPEIEDPLAASAELRAERDGLRVIQQEQQALAEAIIQSQVSELLVEYGFEMGGGQLFPPVTIRFTQLPTMMIISRRDKIERVGAYPLEHGLTVDQMQRIEADVEEELDVSTLIVPIGGLAVWPAMLVESSYLPWVMDVSAHEWTHHYLSFFPLGFNYGQSGELVTINETVASIVGTEIGWAVTDRYYPDLAPPPPDYTPVPEPEPGPPGEAIELEAFDFRAEMRETRVQVDQLLAEGRIEQAEQYMETRRVLFVEQGYNIRKLNQAYFAFYGSYADEPGATGADPIGPALRELRYYSNSLNEFVALVRGVTTFDEIQSVLNMKRSEANSDQ